MPAMAVREEVHEADGRAVYNGEVAAGFKLSIAEKPGESGVVDERVEAGFIEIEIAFPQQIPRGAVFCGDGTNGAGSVGHSRGLARISG